MSERDTVDALAELLARLGIDWVLFGALAANRYRVTTRTTHDVDLLLLDAGPGLEALESAFREAGWEIRRATAGGELLRARHPVHGLADLVIAGTQYEREALARARAEDVGGLEVRVLAPEDVIVFKLIAGRTQDIADVEAILAAKPVLDEDYLESWARAWDVFELWRRVRSGPP